MSILFHPSKLVDSVSERLSGLENWLIEDVFRGWTPLDIPDLHGKVALVTGANSGMGFETARKLAENGAKVFLVARTPEKAQDAVERIRKSAGKGVDLEVLTCDFAYMRNVADLAKEFRRKSSQLDILVNMHGLACRPFFQTDEGLEHVMAVNYLSHAMLTLELLDTLRHTPGSRVIFMSSIGESIGHLDWDNLTGEKFRDSGSAPYGASKMLQLMFAREISMRVPEVDFICVHPGVVMTPGEEKATYTYLSSVFLKINAHLFGQTPYRGAYSTLYAATQPSLTGTHHGYYGPNFFNLFPTSPRVPINVCARNPQSCWKVFEDTAHILQRITGSKASFTIPKHPDDHTERVPTPKRVLGNLGLASA